MQSNYTVLAQRKLCDKHQPSSLSNYRHYQLEAIAANILQSQNGEKSNLCKYYHFKNTFSSFWFIFNWLWFTASPTETGLKVFKHLKCSVQEEHDPVLTLKSSCSYTNTNPNAAGKELTTFRNFLFTRISKILLKFNLTPASFFLAFSSLQHESQVTFFHIQTEPKRSPQYGEINL